VEERSPEMTEVSRMGRGGGERDGDRNPVCKYFGNRGLCLADACREIRRRCYLTAERPVQTTDDTCHSVHESALVAADENRFTRESFDRARLCVLVKLRPFAICPSDGRTGLQ